MKYIDKIIKEVCIDNNIILKNVSDNWIKILEKDNITRYISGYKFPLNDYASGYICDDKSAFCDILKLNNIPVVEHKIVFKNYNRDEIVRYAELFSYDMVVKNNMGTCGEDMYHVNSKGDLFKCIDEILIRHYSVSLSPYYDIKNEYRSIVFNNNVELFYGKIKPVVIGNGKDTIYELLNKFNPYFFNNIKCITELNRVLNIGEVYEYNWQHNLAKGALAFLESNEEKTKKIKSLALQVTGLLNLNFVSVDVIELVNGEFLVLEANSGVMMEKIIEIIPNGYNIVKKIYKKAILEMFK